MALGFMILGIIVGTVAAVMAFATIPMPVRMVLAERAERNDYDDVVLIDRDSIKSHSGRHAYGPDLRSMHFGGKGKICDSITRKWKSDHVESAMVFCEGTYCVARPSVCNNLSLITRLPERKAEAAGYAPEATNEDAAVLAAAPLFAAPAEGLFAVAAVGGSDTAVFGGGGAYSGGSVGAGGGGGSFCCAGPAVTTPVTPIPEPGTWALIMAGIVAGAYRVKHR